MEKTMYRKIEGKLYNYFRRARQLERFRRILHSTGDRQARIEQDIAQCNHRIENPIRSQAFDRVGSGGGFAGSPIEDALIRAYEQLELELARVQRRYVETLETVNRIEEELEPMTLLIEGLSEPYRNLVELKYCSRMTYREIGDFMAMDCSTIQRQMTRIMADIMDDLVDMD